MNTRKSSHSLLHMYLRSAQQAGRMTLRNWLCLIGMCLLGAGMSIAMRLVGGLGIAGGFILGLLAISCLTLYYRWIRESCNGHKLKARELLEFDWGLFSSIMNAGFFLWLIELVNRALAQSESMRPVSILISVGLFIFLNPLAEVVYRDESDAMGSLKRSAAFLQRYWLEWLLPLSILLLPMIRASMEQVTSLMAFAWVLVPVLSLFDAASFALASLGIVLDGQWQQAIGFLPPLIVAHWFMLFRGFLFLELSARGPYR